MKPCRHCGGEVTQYHRIKKHDWICKDCNHKYLSERRKEAAVTEVEVLEAQLFDSKVANGVLRLRLYDLERCFRRAKEAGIELPDPSDYSGSGAEYEKPERARPRDMPDTRGGESDEHGL